jgi:adenine-specific DNA-methyltransferase
MRLLEDWQEDEKGFFKQGANLKATGGNAPREKRPNLYFPIFIDDSNTVYVTLDDDKPKKYTGELVTLYPITKEKEMSWRWSKNKFIKDIDDVIVSRNGAIGIYKKQRPALGNLPSKKPKTIFYKPEYSSGNGTAEIKSLFNDKVFTNPKPSKLLKDFIEIGLTDEDIILDFFAGSGTTADAVMQLNAKDDGSRKFILAQLPEKIWLVCFHQKVTFVVRLTRLLQSCNLPILAISENIKSYANKKSIDIDFITRY